MKISVMFFSFSAVMLVLAIVSAFTIGFVAPLALTLVAVVCAAAGTYCAVQSGRSRRA